MVSIRSLPSSHRLRALLLASLTAGCVSSSARLYDGPKRGPEEVARVHTGEGFWGDKEIFLAEVNGTRLWDPDSATRRMFRTFLVKNDVRVLPGRIDLVAGQGQGVGFEADAGATYRLSLAPSFHDTIPLLVVTEEPDQRFVVDSEPRLSSLSTAPWELLEGWSVADWRRYRPPHADVEVDVVTYVRPAAAGPAEDSSGPTWITSIGLDVPVRPAERMALSCDMLLDLELDYRGVTTEVLSGRPRLLRWSGVTREGANDVSGLVVVGRAGDTLRAISCVGPGGWASRASAWEARLTRAVGEAR